MLNHLSGSRTRALCASTSATTGSRRRVRRFPHVGPPSGAGRGPGTGLERRRTGGPTGMSEGDLPTHLRNQRDWRDAINKAEQSGDLAGIIRLICSGVPVDQSTRIRLEALSNDHRVVCKKRGPKKKQLSMKDIYAEAAHYVRVLEEAKRRWKEWDGARDRCARQGGRRLDRRERGVQRASETRRGAPLWNKRAGLLRSGAKGPRLGEAG